MLIDIRRHVRLGVPENEAAISVPTPEPAKGTAFPPRRLLLHGRSVFELSLWCGTCPMLFKKLSAPEQADLELTADDLRTGLVRIDEDLLGAYGPVVPESTYTVMLLELVPQLVHAGESGDYFTNEQVRTWGADPLDGAADDPGTPYYRTFETAVDEERHLYEFVIPMVPPSWNDGETVATYASNADDTVPTAVSYSILDVIAPAVDQGEDWYWHWLLQHFLLDGHHKIEAAARTNRPVRLLCLVDERISMATDSDMDHVAEARTRPRTPRPAPAE